MRNVAIAAVVWLSGCTTWTTVREYDEHIPGGAVEVRADRLLGTVQIEPGFGDLAVALNTDRMCQYAQLPRMQHVVVRHHELTSLGATGLFVGLALTVASRWLIGTPLAVVALPLQLVPLLALRTAPRYQQDATDRPLPDEAVTSCLMRGVELGELALTTPWGETFTDTPDLTGTARFAIWRSAPASPDDARLFGRYLLHLEHGATVGWTPTAEQREQIRAAVSEAHERPDRLQID